MASMSKAFYKHFYVPTETESILSVTWNSHQAFFLPSMNLGRGWHWRVKAYLELPFVGLGLERPARFCQVLQFYLMRYLLPFEGVWRHTCLSVDFSTGRLLLVENGLLLKETVSEELAQMFKVGPTWHLSLFTFKAKNGQSRNPVLYACTLLRQQ